MEQRPPPVVTVSDPSQPGRPVDVLVAGDERPPLDPAVRRRRLRVAGAVVLGAAVVVAGVELRERRAAEAELRRLGAVVALTPQLEGGSSTGGSGGGVRVTADVLLRNDGPAKVTVEDATAGALSAVNRVPLEPGGSGRLQLAMTADCPDDGPPSEAGEDVLLLEVRTVSGARRTELRLPNAAGQGLFARTCGWAPLAESLYLTSVGVVVDDGALELVLEVGSGSREPVSLVDLTVTEGFAVRAPELAAGPLPVPPFAVGGSPVETLVVEVAVDDCDAARRAVREGGVVVNGVFASEDGRRIESGLSLDAAPVEQRVAAVCS